MEKERPRSPVNGQPLPRGRPFTAGEMARENGRKGAEKANAVKAAKKTLREELETLLFASAPNGESMQERISTALIEQASNGNTKAFEIIRDTIGQKPVEAVTINVPDAGIMDEVRRRMEKHA